MSVDRTLQSIADVLAANEQHMVPRDPNQPEPHWRDITGLPEPRPVPSPEDRMADARTDTPHTFRTYLDATERDQLDARAAAAEAERDEATDDLKAARVELELVSGNRDRIRRELDATEQQRDRYRQALDSVFTERDDYREARDVLRAQLDTAREDAYRDIARQIDILAADPGILRDWLTTCHPQPISFGELFHALAEKLRRPTPPPSSVPSRRAQEG